MPLVVTHRVGAAGALKGPLVIVPIAKGPLAEGFASLDQKCGGALTRCLASGDFTGAVDDAALLYTGPDGPERVLLLGVGDVAQVSAATLRRAAMIGGKRARVLGAPSAALFFLDAIAPAVSADRAGQSLAEGVPFGAWHYPDLKRPPEAPKPVFEHCEIVTADASAEFAAGVARGNAVAAGQQLTRRLQMLPGNTCTPEYLAAQARELGGRHGFAVTTMDKPAITKAGMQALIAVAQGSAVDPRFIILEHRGSTGAPVVLIGKGVTFDTGGISIKPAPNMEEMKYDMSGAAAVLGAFETIGQLKPTQHVIGLIPSCENMPSSTAYKPGDVVGSHLGKTIEVVNTDAEGRLILADALSWARQYAPAAVIDCATLTGAIVIGLGHTASGLMGTDRALLDAVRAAGDAADERVWELPLWDEYRDLIKSDIADMKNSGGRAAGSITAGWFLREFAEGYPWAHVDIAGTAYTERESATQVKGPTGVMVRLFAEYLRARLIVTVRAPVLAVVIGALAATVVGPLRAQQQDSIQIHRADSLRADSIKRADTLSTTERLLKAQKDQQVQLRPMPRCGVSTLLPAGSRFTFDRDSIDWVAAESVSELLQRIPGVFLEQTDWLGSTQIPNYFGRGAASVEYVVDCVPMLPMGVDSVAVDPSPWPLSLLDRVEVEVSPGQMRVFLFTKSHDRAAPRTEVGIAQGNPRTAARYQGIFEQRWASGLGVSLGADYLGVNGSGDALATGTGGDNIASGWFQFGYVPSARFGIQAQLLSTRMERDLLLDGVTQDTLTRQTDGSRTDLQLRAAFRQRADGLGRSLDLFAVHTAWSSDSAPGSQGIGGFGAVGALRQATWSAQLSAWHFSRQTPLDTRLDLGWAPSERVSGSVQLVGQRYNGDRGGAWATARAGLKLPLGFRIGGVLSSGQRVQAPSVLDDTPQRFSDAELTAGFDSKRVTLDAGYVSNDAWRAWAFPEFVAIANVAPLPRTQWLTAHVRVAPVGFFTLETTYQSPLSGALPDASPPQHMISTATIRSRFLHNFRSGIFDLKIQGIMENWGAGVGGRDTLGNAIPLPAATFFRAVFQMQIGPFIVYYNMVNLQATRTGYVPGYPIIPIGSNFGIRWQFSN